MILLALICFILAAAVSGISLFTPFPKATPLALLLIAAGLALQIGPNV